MRFILKEKKIDSAASISQRVWGFWLGVGRVYSFPMGLIRAFVYVPSSAPGVCVCVRANTYMDMHVYTENKARLCLRPAPQTPGVATYLRRYYGLNRAHFIVSDVIGVPVMASAMFPRQTEIHSAALCTRHYCTLCTYLFFASRFVKIISPLSSDRKFCFRRSLSLRGLLEFSLVVSTSKSKVSEQKKGPCKEYVSRRADSSSKRTLRILIIAMILFNQLIIRFANRKRSFC